MNQTTIKAISGLLIIFSFCSKLSAQTSKKPLNIQENLIIDSERSGSSQIIKFRVQVQLKESLETVAQIHRTQNSNAQNGLETIMSESFEGNFPPSGWTVSSGDYTWGARNYVAHSGNNSAWAIGGGTLGSSLTFGAYYPNSIETMLIYGPFDLSDANWAAFSFSVWLNTEQSYDFIQFMASEDGTNFSGYAVSGSSNGAWLGYSLPLTAVPVGESFENYTGKSAVWIAFGFVSDNMVNYANGAFVDDVLLQKGMVNEPIVVSSFATPGPSSRGLAHDGTNLWCSDATNDMIYKLNPGGGIITSFSSPGSTPTGLTWDGSNLWNADITNLTIYKLSTGGTVLSSFASPGDGPTGLAWDGNNLWNSDYTAATIWKLNISGTVLGSFSAPGTYHYGMTYAGQHLWLVDADMLLMYKIDLAGNVLDYYLTPGSFPNGLAYDGNYFWLSDRNTDLIYKLQVQTQQYANDVGVIDMDLPIRLSPGDSTAIKVTIKNYGTASQNNFPVSNNMNGGTAVTENFTGTLAAGATATMTFSKMWKPTMEGSYGFMAWTSLAGDENTANDSLSASKTVEVSSIEITEILVEDFEKYPTGVLADAPGSPWVRYSSSRNGNVTTKWVHGGQQNFQINSFTTSTEIDYALLNLTKKPDQLNVELWYTPDGFYVYKDFASVGLSYVASKYDMTQKASFWGSDKDVKFKAEGMGSEVTVFNQLDYGSGPAPSGTPKHNYIRAEFDFKKSQVRFYIGTNSSAPLRSTVNLVTNFQFNALFFAGGLNETYIDDIRVTMLNQKELAKDIGAIAMNLPDTVSVGTAVPVGVVVKNFGTTDQSNFPVSYRINDGTAVTENFTTNLSAGASATKTFSAAWTPNLAGAYHFKARTSLVGDENPINDSLALPKQVIVKTGGVNTSPTLNAIGNQAVTGGQTKNVLLSATDTDGDPLSFTILTNPGFLSITNFSQTGNTATATLVLSPGTTLSGIYNATVQVSDSKGGVDSEDFTVEVIPPPSAGHWSRLNPKFGLNSLGPVMFVDSQTGWIADYNNLLHTTDGGMTWDKQTVGTSSQLYSCFFTNKDTGWVVTGKSISQVGPRGTIFKTTDGGQTWMTQLTDVVGLLRSVHFINSNIGWAVGGEYQTSTILKTTNGGLTWITQTSPIARSLYSVYFIDANTGWAVGEYKTIVKTADGGQTWIAKNSGIYMEEYNSVFFVNAQTGWIAGSTEVIKTIDGGENWTIQNLGSSRWFQSVFFINPLTGWIISNSPNAIHKTTNGGSSWTIVDVPSSLKSVHFSDSQNGWAVGDKGLVMKTTDGGNSWTNQSWFTMAELWSAYFLDVNTGWLGGSGGVLAKTTNAGSNWTVFNTSGNKGINAIYFADSKNGWACQNTGKILRTTNGGDSWSQISTTTTRDFYGMFFLNSKIGWVVGGATAVEGIVYKTTDGGSNWVSQGKPTNTPLMAVFFVDNNTGWAVGMDGVIIKTSNGGTDWIVQNSGGTSWFTDVYFQDANVGFAVGDGVILRTTNSGNTWIPKGSIAGIVEDIRFIDQMNGWAVGTGAGVAKGIGGNTAGIHLLSYGSSKIWRTEDGGETWTEELLAGQWLLSTFFNDLNSGWAVGNYGNIFKYANSLPLPQPPSDLKALAISKTELQLFWTDNSTTENGFHIYRSAGVSGEYKFLTTVGKDSASYTDAGLSDGTTYWYRLDAFNAYGNSAKSKDASATAGVILSVDVQPDVPLRFALKQNYPNPFNPSTVIQYSIPKASQVELTVFDLLGRELKVLVNGKQEAGIYQVQFDSQGLPAGLYFYRLRAGEFCETRKMAIIK